ncbi:ROK family transcriptional regulator [Corynebacterium ulceribovis]|uniref:ROK family transcriptional regulator n=1 Tax=Corynebacterium ulceribovis TaxID=487732 RepID=UPI0003635F1C|nr:ROK family transcriptional regulator [Corynebacterium ulceribovis]
MYSSTDFNAKPSFSTPVQPAARCLHQLRIRENLTRPELAEDTNLSQATVTRQITALIAAGLIRERTDLAVSGTAGRPRIPLELAPSPWMHAGIHLGLTTSRVALVDTHGRIIREVSLEIKVRGADPQDVLEKLIARVHLLRNGLPLPLRTVGIALPGQSRETDDGVVVDSQLFDWIAVPVEKILNDELGVPATIAPNVAAMAASELFATPLKPGHNHDETAALYFYGREQIGVALIISGAVHLPVGGDGSIGHLEAAKSDLLGSPKHTSLQETAGETAVLAAARRAGITVEKITHLVKLGASNPVAREILNERARVLGEAIVQAADIVDPHHVVLAGKAFTQDPAGLHMVARTVELGSIVHRDLRVSQTHGGVTLEACRAVAMDALYSDPLMVAGLQPL